jgi:hypothetical protein
VCVLSSFVRSVMEVNSSVRKAYQQ